jgi:uncharacterized protein YgiM (DUF1202 family)
VGRTMAKKQAHVVAAYDSPYTQPLVIRAGEELAVEERPSEWGGWLWCTTRGGESRWVPASYVQRRDDGGLLLRDYEATELAVRAGEEVSLGQEESGWFWCTNRAGQSGWVPKERLD